MQISTVAALGGAVRQRRRELGLTQAEVALRSACSREWISRVEGGSQDRAEIGALLRVVNALGLTLSLSPLSPGPGGFGNSLEGVSVFDGELP